MLDGAWLAHHEATGPGQVLGSVLLGAGRRGGGVLREARHGRGTEGGPHAHVAHEDIHVAYGSAHVALLGTRSVAWHVGLTRP